MEDESNSIKLISDIKLHERLFMGFFSALGYGFCSLSSIISFSKNVLSPSSGVTSESVLSVVENNNFIWRSKARDKPLVKSFKGFHTIPELLFASAKSYPKKKMLGRREVISKCEELDSNTMKTLIKYELGDFTWLTYEKVVEIVCSCSQSLIDLQFNGESKMALFANTSPEWLITAFSLMNVSSPIVTVYSTLSDDYILHAFNLTEITGVLVDEKTLLRILKMAHLIPSLRYIVVSGHMEKSCDLTMLPKHHDCKASIIHFSTLIDKHLVPNISCRNAYVQNADSLALIMFTSGSTGIPKGVMISHRNILSVLGSVTSKEKLWKNQTYAAYLPSAHIFEFLLEIAMTGYGSSIGYCTPLTLFDTSPMIKQGTSGDLSLLKPTIIVTVPLLLERVKKGVEQNIKSKSRFKQLLFQNAYNIKLHFHRHGYSTPILDLVIFRPLMNLFGGKLVNAIIGGAYISPNTEEFSNICFGNFKQGYGLTETCAGATLNNFESSTSGNVGIPLDCCEIMLVPWKEAGYYPNDGNNNPKGEIVIRGANVAIGYFKNDDLTAECFKVDSVTGNRWFYTGDIGEVLPDMKLRIIDRKKDMIKLLHGEYVSLVKVETCISECLLVDLICVLPCEPMSHLVALIIPNRERTLALIQASAIKASTSDFDALISDVDVLKVLEDSISTFAKNAKLSKHEVPEKYRILTDLWTPENGLVTPSMKVRRSEIAKKYRHLLV